MLRFYEIAREEKVFDEGEYNISKGFRITEMYR